MRHHIKSMCILITLLLLQWFIVLYKQESVETYLANFQQYLMFLVILMLFAANPTIKLFGVYVSVLIVINAFNVFGCLNQKSAIDIVSTFKYTTLIPLLTAFVVGVVFYPKNDFKNITVKSARIGLSTAISAVIIIAVFVIQTFDLFILFDEKGRLSSFYHPYVIFLLWVLFLKSPKLVHFVFKSVLFVIANISGLIINASIYKIEVKTTWQMIAFLNIIPVAVIIVGSLFYPRQYNLAAD